MRSTRASAAWAGIALATSFLSVMIIGTQPHNTATRAIAESVAMTSTRDALSSIKPVKVVKQAKASDNATANAAR